jgi:mono/diheme cytochrome c family protein
VAAALLAAVVSAAAQEWVAPAEERARANPVAATPEALQKGRFLYRKHCQKCHGEKGKGDGPSGRYGVKPAEDLTSPAKQAKLTDGEIFWKITDEDRWRLVLFVRSLATPPSPAP